MPENDTIRRYVNYNEWGEYYNVMHEFLPFERRNFPAVDIMEQVTEIIADTPNTAKTIKAGNIGSKIDSLQMHRSNIQKLGVMMSFHGAWIPPGGTGDGTSTVYMNPNYIHLENLSDEYYYTTPENRREAIERAAYHGNYGQRTLATQFGIQENGVESFVYRNLDDTWKSLREEGRTRVACTWKTLYDWGYSQKRIADVFGCPAPSLRRFLQEHLPEDYTPPVDPTTDLEEIRRFSPRVHAGDDQTPAPTAD